MTALFTNFAPVSKSYGSLSPLTEIISHYIGFAQYVLLNLFSVSFSQSLLTYVSQLYNLPIFKSPFYIHSEHLYKSNNDIKFAVPCVPLIYAGSLRGPFSELFYHPFPSRA